jgi:hypothetical protein
MEHLQWKAENESDKLLLTITFEQHDTEEPIKIFMVEKEDETIDFDLVGGVKAKDAQYAFSLAAMLMDAITEHTGNVPESEK